MKQLVCESLHEFYVVESIQDAKKIFVEADYDVDKEDKEFYKQFINNYKNHPEYIAKLATWITQNIDDWEKLDQIYNEYIRLKKEKLIDKSINDFSKLKDFQKYVEVIKKKEEEQIKKLK
jgi:hypothetical protein